MLQVSVLARFTLWRETWRDTCLSGQDNVSSDRHFWRKKFYQLDITWPRNISIRLSIWRCLSQSCTRTKRTYNFHQEIRTRKDWGTCFGRILGPFFSWLGRIDIISFAEFSSSLAHHNQGTISGFKLCKFFLLLRRFIAFDHQKGSTSAGKNATYLLPKKGKKSPGTTLGKTYLEWVSWTFI